MYETVTSVCTEKDNQGMANQPDNAAGKSLVEQIKIREGQIDKEETGQMACVYHTWKRQDL